jgi:hypothetical protein
VALGTALAEALAALAASGHGCEIGDWLLFEGVRGTRASGFWPSRCEAFKGARGGPEKPQLPAAFPPGASCPGASSGECSTKLGPTRPLDNPALVSRALTNPLVLNLSPRRNRNPKPTQWPARSRPLASPRVARPPGSSWPPRCGSFWGMGRVWVGQLPGARGRQPGMFERLSAVVRCCEVLLRAAQSLRPCRHTNSSPPL